MSEYIAAAKSANLEELKAFQARYYGPAHMTLVLAGDVADADTQAEVAKAFSGWSGGQDYIRPAKPAQSSAASEVTVPLADKPSVTRDARAGERPASTAIRTRWRCGWAPRFSAAALPAG